MPGFLAAMLGAPLVASCSATESQALSEDDRTPENDSAKQRSFYPKTPEPNAVGGHAAASAKTRSRIPFGPGELLEDRPFPEPPKRPIYLKLRPDVLRKLEMERERGRKAPGNAEEWSAAAAARTSETQRARRR